MASNSKNIDPTLGQEYPAGLQRSNYLRDNCDVVEEKGYMKKFYGEEVAEQKNKLSEVDIALDDIEQELAALKESYKMRMKPLIKERTDLLLAIKQGAQFVKEPCYKFLYPENRLAVYYNADGEIIETRAMHADEFQKNIFQEMKRTGTEG